MGVWSENEVPRKSTGDSHIEGGGEGPVSEKEAILAEQIEGKGTNWFLANVSTTSVSSKLTRQLGIKLNEVDSSVSGIRIDAKIQAPICLLSTKSALCEFLLWLRTWLHS